VNKIIALIFVLSSMFMISCNDTIYETKEVDLMIELPFSCRNTCGGGTLEISVIKNMPNDLQNIEVIFFEESVAQIMEGVLEFERDKWDYIEIVMQGIYRCSNQSFLYSSYTMVDIPENRLVFRMDCGTGDILRR
jgi:hypothetical protein